MLNTLIVAVRDRQTMAFSHSGFAVQRSYATSSILIPLLWCAGTGINRRLEDLRGASVALFL